MSRKVAGAAREHKGRCVRSDRFAGHPAGSPDPMFFFFSNRLGCLPSLLLSAVLTLVLLLVLGVL
jgi:hypothetical protein